MSLHLSVRKATEDDCKLLFDWANEPEVRKASFSTEKIEWSGHTNWFFQKLKNPNSLILIFEADGSPAGLIRFDKDTEQNYFLISFLLDEKFRGMSLGTTLISEGLAYLSSGQQGPIVCVGFVKKENVASQRAFYKNEFLLESESDDNLKFIKTIE
ncbi:GNAT family N-acetyltransferase [Leptospira vanthielii]|uniref:GNAT family N-acetyltransferase n=1 Tax=Leptospira vanthielii TaxID=293085 RepID=UPI001E59D292|nr:GNAT family N-acetyltransferase [Leptospira vanthielii]